MSRAVTLAEFRPPTRADNAPWVTARIEESDDRADWDLLKAVPLDPTDPDPAHPALRSFTVGTSEPWLRIVWVDGEGNESEPSPLVATSGQPFRPTVADVSAILRARTYTSTGADDDPMSVLVGGSLVGTFSADTRPTAAEVEEMIPLSAVDVVRSVGQIPGEYIEDARRVAALGVAAEIERSYIPDQTSPDGSIFQTLRLTYGEEATKLRQTLQWWALTEGLERRS